MVKIYKQPFAHSGDTIAIPDASQPDGKMSSVEGWPVDYQLPKTNPDYKPVGRMEMNGVFKEVTEALGQVQVQGAASWSADGAPYPINAQVYHSGKQWIALRANSVEPTEGEDWSAWGDSLRQDLANPDKGAAMVARGVVAVDSIADLLALSGGQKKEGLRYLVKEYHAGTGVGGGEFYWDSGRSASDHDGGTIIDPAKAFPADWEVKADREAWFTASEGMGVWVRNHANPVNVMWFGAKPNNPINSTSGTDNTESFNAAINSICHEIYIPSGGYKIESTLIIPLAGGRVKNLSITGDFTSANHLNNITNITYTGTGALFDFRLGTGSQTNCEGFNLDGIAFYGDVSVPGTSVINAYKLYGSTFRNCSFSRFHTGIIIEDYSFYNVYDNLSFKTMQKFGVRLLNAANGSTFKSCRWNQIDVSPTSGAVGVCVEVGDTAGLNFTGCWFETANTAILLSGIAKSVSLNQCYMEGCYRFFWQTVASKCSVYVKDTYTYFYYHNSRYVLPVTGSEMELKVENSPIHRDPDATNSMVIVSYVGGGSNVQCQFINSPWDAVWSRGDMKALPDKDYTQNNILGNVSATGTYPSLVPTGAIIETMTNDRGTYIKYANGTMITTQRTTITRDITIEHMGGFRSSSAENIQLPAAFANIDYAVAVSCSSTGIVPAFPARYGPSLTSQLWSGSSESGVTVVLDIVCTGRWV